MKKKAHSRTGSTQYGNCITEQKEHQNTDDLKALKKSKAYEERHIYEKIVVDRRTVKFRVIGEKPTDER